MLEHTFCIFSTIRAPLADTLSFVNYHLNIGIDHLYLFFDDPLDHAADVLSQEKKVTCIRCDSIYWAGLVGKIPKSNLSINARQEINSRVAIKKSREDDYQWICHIDGDELIYAPNGFKKAIESIPHYVQVAKFPVLEAIPEKLSANSIFQDLRYFKQAPVVLPKNKSLYLDPSEYFLFYKNWILYRVKKVWSWILGYHPVIDDFIKGHSIGKSIARTNSPITTFYSHFPLTADQDRLKFFLLPNVKILHFDSPDYDRWKTKWEIRYKNIKNGIIPLNLSKHRRDQFKKFSNIYENGIEQALIELFTKDYIISPSDIVILQRAGLVSEINLPSELFSQV